MEGLREGNGFLKLIRLLILFAPPMKAAAESLTKDVSPHCITWLIDVNVLIF